MKTKLISYVLPLYNVENYILRCIESLQHQNMSEDEYEIICIDDGSSDNSFAIVEGLIKNGVKNIILKKIENSGPGIARNIGFEMTKSKYVFFVDGDDYIADNSIIPLIKVAERGNADIVYFDYARTCNNDLYLSKFYSIPHKIETSSGKSFFVKYKPGNGAWCLLLKSQFLRDKGIRFDSGYCEDGRFVINAFNQAEKCVYLHADIYRYVRRPGSIITRGDVAHKEKVICGFLDAISLINNLARNEQNKEYFEALINRRNDYLFHLQIRIIKQKADISVVKRILKLLAENNSYPYAYPKELPWGIKNGFIHWVMNHNIIYILSCQFYRFLVK